MNKNKAPYLVLILLLVGLVGLFYFNGGAINKVPDITVSTIHGEKIALSTLNGKPALITFWATDCPGCIKEIPHLKAIHADYTAKGVPIIAIPIFVRFGLYRAIIRFIGFKALWAIAMKHDRPDHVIAMADAKKLPYKIALDPMGEAAQAFGNVRLTPTTFLIAPDSTIVMHKLGVFNEKKMRQQLDSLLAES